MDRPLTAAGYLNTTVYDEVNGLAKIQPGSDWERVFDALDPYDVSSVGGRASVVGVGGFITGGGVSELRRSCSFMVIPKTGRMNASWPRCCQRGDWIVLMFVILVFLPHQLSWLRLRHRCKLRGCASGWLRG